jgi:hypothetical protein
MFRFRRNIKKIIVRHSAIGSTHRVICVDVKYAVNKITITQKLKRIRCIIPIIGTKYTKVSYTGAYNTAWVTAPVG